MSLKSSFQILLNFESTHEPSKQLREKREKWLVSKLDKKEGNLDTAFRTGGESRSSWSDWLQVAAHTSAQRGISARCFKKKGGASPQSSLPKTHTPRSPPLP